MPLLDHFHPPLSDRRHWEAFHSRWASSIADDLNDHGLPEYHFAEPTVQIGGQVQVDVATLDESTSEQGSLAVATLPHVAKVGAPTWTIPATFSDSFEVQVINGEGGPRLVAAIELLSPSNKDRPQTRRAFAFKCANYLCQGISCIVVDVVTNRAANLHNEIMDLMQNSECHLAKDAVLYATAYRPLRRDKKEEIEIWPTTFNVGDGLPSLPLFIGPDFSLLVDFEASYKETCRRLRLVA